jgi:alkylation response protein AidB-like acyl-CoA dehydrogenase
MSEENKAKDAAMELAEDSRQADWEFPSFTAELYKGNFRWDLMHPFPAQSAEDKKIGDDYLEKLKTVCVNDIDPEMIDQNRKMPDESLKALTDIGAFGMKIDTKYDGLGFSMTNYARALTYLGSYCQTSVTWVSAHQSIGVPQPLKIFGTEEQKQKFLPRLAKGEISAFALTEPDVGSDPAKMSTTAEPTEDGEHYIINGEKLWITNGTAASIIVVMAKTPPKVVNGREIPQISAFIVESNMPGYSIEKHCEFMGLNGIANGVLAFKDVKVPKDYMIGKPGEGLKIALTTLNTGRLGLPAASVGGAKLALKEIRKWVNDRVQWGVPIGKHQSIAKKISNAAADTFAMEAIVYLSAAFADHGQKDIRLEAAIAKYFCTEKAWSMTDELIQVRGGRGYETAKSLHNRGDRPFPIERMLRDARIGRIFEGSSEVMHLIIAREAMDMHFKLVMPILMPKPGQKEGKLSLALKAAKFYAGWLPKLFIPSGQSFNVKHLNAANQDHLSYVERVSRKMARKMFFTMGKYKQKLETEQLILANFVDVGVDIFAMAATLSYAESKLAENPNDTSPQELADLFCKNARQRIAANFEAVGNNHNSDFDKVGSRYMEGAYEWLEKGVHTELPKSLRTPVEDTGAAANIEKEIEEPVPAK